MKLAFGLLWILAASDLLRIGAACDSADECDVQAAYCRVLDREGDSSGIEGYVSDLRAGDTTLKEIVLEMCQSDEYERRFVADQSSESIVEHLFDAIFARDADEGGLESWINKLETGDYTYREICENFVTSDEYEQRFGSSNVPGGGRNGCGSGVVEAEEDSDNEDSENEDSENEDLENEDSDNEEGSDTTLCIPCEWSKYEKWSDCSNVCDGSKHRSRTCECPSSTDAPSCNDGCSSGGDQYEEEDTFTDWDDCNESDGEFYLENVELPGFYLSVNDAVNTVGATNLKDLRLLLQHCDKALVEENSGDFHCLERDDSDDVFLSDDCNDKKEQEWELKKSGNSSKKKSAKYYLIRNKKEKCCIDIFRGGVDGGITTVDCQECVSDNEDQLWKIIELED